MQCDQCHSQYVSVQTAQKEYFGKLHYEQDPLGLLNVIPQLKVLTAMLSAKCKANRRLVSWTITRFLSCSTTKTEFKDNKLLMLCAYATTGRTITIGKYKVE